MTKKLIRYKLEEIEMVVLLSGLLGAIELGKEILDAICSLNVIFKEQNIHRSVLLFYINALCHNPYLV